MADAAIFIVAVPTLIDTPNRPHVTLLECASEMGGRGLKPIKIVY